MHGSEARAALNHVGKPIAAELTQLTSVDALLDAVVAEALVADVVLAEA